MGEGGGGIKEELTLLTRLDVGGEDGGGEKRMRGERRHAKTNFFSLASRLRVCLVMLFCYIFLTSQVASSQACLDSTSFVISRNRSWY